MKAESIKYKKRSSMKQTLLRCVFVLTMSSCSSSAYTECWEKDLARIAELAPHAPSASLRILCEALQKNQALSESCIMQACTEAFFCLEQIKDQIEPAELEHLAASAERACETLLDEADGTESTHKAVKKYSNLLVRKALSSGSVYVGGDTIINHNLQVNNDVTIQGNETIAGNLTVEGDTILSGSVILTNPDIGGSINLIGTPQQACIIFKDANSTEKARLCSSPSAGDKGLFISVDGGTTQNFRVNNEGGVTIAQPASGAALAITGGSSTTTPALRLIGNPAAVDGNYVLQIDSATGIVTQGIISTGTGDIKTLQANSGTASGYIVNVLGGSNITTTGDNAATLTIDLVASPSVSGSITAGNGLNVTAGPTNLGNSSSTNTIEGATSFIGSTFMSNPTGGVVLTITGNASNPALVAVGNSSTTAPALRLFNIPTAVSTDVALTIDSLGNVKQGTNPYTNVLFNGGQAGPVILGTTNNTTLSFITNGSNALTINGSQNIGIGTATPITQLNVVQNNPSVVGSLTTGSTPASVYVQGRYVFVVNSTSNTLQIFDASNVTTPILVGSVATGTTPQSVYVQGRYAYVVNSGSSTLQIFDIGNQAAPVQVSGGSVATGTAPTSVYVQGRYAYVVNNTANTLQVFDVYNPSAPVAVGSVATGTAPRAVYVQTIYAYVVNSTSNTLQVFNIANPVSPSLVGSVAAGTTPVAVYVQERYAYVVNSGASTLQVFDISNPASPTSVSSVATNTTPQSVFVQGRYAYVTNSAGNSLQLFDVSNPAAMVAVGSMTSTGASSVFIQGRYAYLVSATGNVLQVVDVGGSYIQQFEAGSIEVGTLQTRGNLTINNDLDVKGGATIGRSLQVSGNVGITGTLSQTSDARKKKVIGEISQALALIHKLRPVKYQWSAEARQTNPQLDTKEHFGFLAQEVAEVLPQLVSTNEQGEYALDYIGIIPVATAALKEQNALIRQLFERLKKLEQ